MTKRISRFRFLIHNKTLFKTIFYHFFNNKKSLLTGTNLFNQTANKIFNYKFDCSKPRSFNEILCWLKANYRNKQWKTCADKLGAKRFLSENGFDKYVVKTLGVYQKSSDIKLDKLPNKFVLKTNHDSGSVFVCEKGKTNFENVFEQLDQSIEKQYSDQNGEWVYESIKPCIFAEEYLHPKHCSILVDYKFFAFNGTYGWGFTGQNRNIDARFCVFEKDYSIQNVEYIYLKPRKKDIPPKPSCFDEMVKVSEQISRILDFVRVDFYDTDQGPKIGELTFFSQSGYGPFTKKSYDFRYASFFENTNIYKQITGGKK